MTPERPPRPEEPDPDECCGGGCERCVFDLYDERLRAWKELIAELDAADAAARQPPSNDALSPPIALGRGKL